MYGLTLDSSLVSGCFPPLACPVVLAQGISGTFRLTAAPFAAPSLFDTFLVSDVYWLTRMAGEDVPITGSGTYIRGGKSGLQQRLELDLRVGKDEVERFDSGLVPVEPPSPGKPPGIDVAISIHGGRFVDTVIDVRSIPFPPEAKR